jgi:hypothetical protein
MIVNEALDVGVSGAKRSSFRSVNLKEAVLRIIDDNPSGPETRWRELFWEFVRDKEDYLEALTAYVCDLLIRQILDDRFKHSRPNDTKKKTREKEEQAATEAKTKLRERIVREAQIMLLDLMMPNGKTLANCTGADCGRFEGWYAKLKAKVPARKKVGDVLSEGEVRKVWLSDQQ